MKSKKINWQGLFLRQEKMVLDKLRTDVLLKAINKVVKKGDVVVDVGAGAGILSFAAISAGASKVFAIDYDAEALEAAKIYAKRFGFEKKIEFINGCSFDVDIPEKADVLLCETVGSLAYDENIMLTIADAKERFLKTKGIVIPEALELWASPVVSKASKHMWSDVFGFDMSPEEEPFFYKNIVCKSCLLSKPQKLHAVYFNKSFDVDVDSEIQFKLNKSGVIGGIALWPRATWAKGLITDASPLKKATHWEQGILPLEERSVKAGSIISARVVVKPHYENPKGQTEILWKVSS